MKDLVYLDHNATTPIRPDVAALVQDLTARPLNASAVHTYGREGRKYVEAARAQVAHLVGAEPNQVIFNSGATEANNTVLKHFANERVLISAIEHPAVRDVLSRAEIINVTSGGLVDLQHLEDLLKQAPRAGLVSVMMVNNESGVIQPVQQAAALAHKYGALFHSDAVQAVGRIPVNMAALGIDFLSLSSHKIGGPQGVGALALGLCGITPTLLEGGGQEKKARAGTENVAGIAGFGLAARIAAESIENHQGRLSGLQKKLEDRLIQISPDMVIHGASEARVCNTSFFSVEGLSSETLLMAFDLDGVAVSNGAACSSGTVKPSHVLEAMQVSPALASGTLRISTGWNTKDEDIDRFLDLWEKIYKRLKA